MLHRFTLWVASAAILVCLSACGGSGSGGVASAPAPVAPAPVPTSSPSPTPEPTPTPPPPAYQPQTAKIFAEPLYNSQLAVAGKGWQHEAVRNAGVAQNPRDAGTLSIHYDPATKSYSVIAPVAGSGTIMQTGDFNTYPFNPGFPADPSNKSPTDYCCNAFAISAASKPGSRYTYVSFVDLFAQKEAGGGLDTIAYGAFAVAQPTKAGEVPTGGSARYIGDVRGNFPGDAGASWIEGTARLDFDFALAKLTGDIVLSMRCMMGCLYDDVSYSLADTQFARGSATFGGKLSSPGAPSQGTFSGLFAGPGAAELMSQFEVPFFNPEYQRWMTAGGVIVGKRD